MTDRNDRKIRTGTVVSNKMQKTVVVAVERLVQHSLYTKSVRQTVRFKAHDENNDSKVGDKVRIMETRPISKDKHWRVVEIVEKSK